MSDNLPCRAMETQTAIRANGGLEGVIAAETRLSMVDGERGELIVAGQRLALLWDAAGHKGARVNVAALPAATLALLRDAAARRVAPMDALRMAAGTLSAAGDEAAARLLVGSFPTIVAAYARLLRGEEPLAPRASL